MKRLVHRLSVTVALLGVAAFAACKEEPAKAHLQKGNEFFKQEQWAKAAEEFKLSLAADPKQEKLWEKMAVSYMRAADTDGATAALLKTLDFKTEPAKKAEVYRNIGNMLVQGNKHLEAEKYYVEAVKLEPTDLQSLSWLGELELQRGGGRNMQAPAVHQHLDKAITYYDQIIQGKPETSQGLSALVFKRIALTKIMNHEKQQKATAEAEAAALTKREANRKSTYLARAADHQNRVAELQVQVEQVSARITDLQKKGIKLK